MSDDDDDFDEDIGTPQKIGLIAVGVAAVLLSRGKIKPKTAWRVIKLGAGAAVKGGLLGLPTHGGHDPDADARRPLKPPPARPGPLPEQPPVPPRKPPTPSIGQSIVFGVYKQGYLDAMSARVPDGNGLDFLDDTRRLLDGVKVGKPVPGGVSPPSDPVPTAVFGHIADVALNRPRGIVNNLTREGVGQHIGNGITLVAQTADP